MRAIALNLLQFRLPQMVRHMIFIAFLTQFVVTGTISARTAAAQISRATQIQTSVVHNEGGPLAQTVMHQDALPETAGPLAAASSLLHPRTPASGAESAVDQRLRLLEEHLRVVPHGRAPPPVSKDIYARLRAVEERLLQLERVVVKVADEASNLTPELRLKLRLLTSAPVANVLPPPTAVRGTAQRKS